GKQYGYRWIKGGRTLRIPLFEAVDRMDLTNMTIELTVKQAYSKGGIPLTVNGVANIKIPGEEPLIHNALERFLGKSRAELSKIDAQMQVAAKENDRRIVDARTRRAAMIAEQQAEVQALIAQASAEVGMQSARIEQVKLQLQADVIQPAEAARAQAEQNAK